MKGKKKKDLRKNPRWLQMVYAYLHGYFWLPCPICGERFGGHEKGGELYQGFGCGVVVCINCKSKAKKLSQKIWDEEGITVVSGR